MTRWIAAGAACWIAGCASTGHAPPRGEGPQVAATRADCVTQTGSRIPDSGCVGPGHSYSQADLASTGKTTVAGALRLLDPALTIHH